MRWWFAKKPRPVADKVRPTDRQRTDELLKEAGGLADSIEREAQELKALVVRARGGGIA